MAGVGACGRFGCGCKCGCGSPSTCVHRLPQLLDTRPLDGQIEWLEARKVLPIHVWVYEFCCRVVLCIFGIYSVLVIHVRVLLTMIYIYIYIYIYILHRSMAARSGD